MWVEAPSGWLNLTRFQRIAIEPNDQRPSEWSVLAYSGTHKTFIRSFPTRLAAGEFVADLLFGDDEDDDR